MADQNPAGDGAQDQQDQKEENPFAEFQSEGWENGERIADEPTPPAPKKSTPPADEQDDDDDDDGDDDDADDRSDDAAEDADRSDDDAPAPKKKSAKARIGELTRARREAERRSAELERRLAALEAERQQPPPDDEGAAPEGDDAGESDGPPKPGDYQYGELDPEYIAKLAQYHTDQRWAQLQQEQQQRAEQEQQLRRQVEAQTKFQKQVEQGLEKYDDYHELVVLGAQRGDWPLSQELGEMLVESDVGADIAYHLAANPDEAARVYRQTPTEQARYFGKLEAKFSAAQEAATGNAGKEPATPKAPKAPPPVTPPRGAGGRFQPSASTSDFAAFERVAMEN